MHFASYLDKQKNLLFPTHFIVSDCLLLFSEETVTINTEL